MDSRGSYVLHALFLAGIIQLMSQQGHTQVTSVTFKSTKNAYLPVSALNTVSARSSLECMTLCKQKEGCHSCNYFGDGTGACELNSQVANDVEAIQLSQKEEATYHAALYVDCNDVETTGLLNIDISGFGQKTVYCDNGWLVVLRRTDNQVDFHRTWNEYRDGFGDPRDQFWLGNEALYGLTNQGNYSMQIDMKSCDGNYYYVKWNLFRIGAEADRYAINAITVESYNTSTNSYLVENLGWQFGTYDNDIGNTCSALHGGGWWYNDCVRWHLTGTYPVNCDTGAAGMKFASISGNNCNTACMLKAATMKIRRNS